MWRERLLAKRAIATAWYTEAFARMKRLKPIKTYLSDTRAKAIAPADAEKARAEFEAAVDRMAPDRVKP